MIKMKISGEELQNDIIKTINYSVIRGVDTNLLLYNLTVHYAIIILC